VLRDGASFSLADALGMLKGQVADYKLPEAIEFFEELPFTPTGKIRRHVLTSEVQQRIQTGQRG
jgi:acyl-CoA synthetase (AMP-forming)/AMP-acid ligase II